MTSCARRGSTKQKSRMSTKLANRCERNAQSCGSDTDLVRPLLEQFLFLSRLDLNVPEERIAFAQSFETLRELGPVS